MLAWFDGRGRSAFVADGVEWFLIVDHKEWKAFSPMTVKSDVVVFVNTSVSLKFGGRFQSIINRAQHFSGDFSQVVISSVAFVPGINMVYAALRSRYALAENIVFENMHEYLSGEENTDVYAGQDESVIAAIKMQVPEGSAVTFDDASGGYCVSRRIDGFLAMEEWRNQEGVCRRHAVFWEAGNLKQERFFTSAGRLYLVCNYDRQGTRKACYWLGLGGKSDPMRFENLFHLRQYWLAQMHHRYRDPYFMLEARGLDRLVLDNPFVRSCRSIATVHGCHFDEPYSLGSPMRSYTSALFARLGDYDSVVVLTDGQKKDISDQFGPRRNIVAIPHFFKFETGDRLFSDAGNVLEVVMIARLHEEKRVDHLVFAMQKVVDALPEVKCSIYGVGSQEGHLRSLVRKLDLESTVNLAGYTNDPMRALANSSVSVVTSKHEGFGLVILESLSVGTPVVAYDINYGPGDMIQDGVNGRLVEPGNIDSLANALIQVLSRQDRLAEMSRNARAIPVRFEEDGVGEAWRKVFRRVDQLHEDDWGLRARQIALEAAKVSLVDLDIVGTRILGEITLAVSGFVPVRGPLRSWIRCADLSLREQLGGLCLEGDLGIGGADVCSLGISEFDISFVFNVTKDQFLTMLERSASFELALELGTAVAELPLSERFLPEIVDRYLRGTDSWISYQKVAQLVKRFDDRIGLHIVNDYSLWVHGYGREGNCVSLDQPDYSSCRIRLVACGQHGSVLKISGVVESLEGIDRGNTLDLILGLKHPNGRMREYHVAALSEGLQMQMRSSEIAWAGEIDVSAIWRDIPIFGSIDFDAVLFLLVDGMRVSSADYSDILTGFGFGPRKRLRFKRL